MRDQQIVEAMAGIDDQYVFELTDHDHAGWKPPVEPSYLTSHDAMHRVRRSLTDDELKRVGHELETSMGNALHPWVLLARATARDWCTAILKAKGLWQKD